MLFENNWLVQYPPPSHCKHNNGENFSGVAFLYMILLQGVKDVALTVKNPLAKDNIINLLVIY